MKAEGKEYMEPLFAGDSGGGSSRWAMGRHEHFIHWSNIAQTMSGEHLYVCMYVHIYIHIICRQG